MFGPIWGTGEGRGIALLISLFGVISVGMVLLAWSIRSIRLADTELPDENLEHLQTGVEGA